MDKVYQDIHIIRKYGECVYRKVKLIQMRFTSEFVLITYSQDQEDEECILLVPKSPGCKLVID